MNPVVETFAELFKPLERAEPEVIDYRAKGKKDLEDWSNQSINAIFSQALGQYQGVTVHGNVKFDNVNYGVVFTEEAGHAGDTVRYYDVNDPATWSNFLPPEVLEAELPATPKRKRRRK